MMDDLREMLSETLKKEREISKISHDALIELANTLDKIHGALSKISNGDWVKEATAITLIGESKHIRDDIEALTQDIDWYIKMLETLV